MKILFAHFGVFEKGGWGRTFPLAQGLVKLGNEVTIITTNSHYSIFIKRKRIYGVDVIIFPDIVSTKITSKGFGILSLFLKSLYVIFNKFDIVHSDEGHRPQSGIPCRINKKLFGAKYIAEWWDWFGKGGQYESKSKIFKIFLGRYELKSEIKDKLFADGIVVLSDVLMLRAQSLKSEKKVIKLLGGANVNAISYIDDNKFLKEKFGIEKNIITFGYIDALGQDLQEIKPLIDAVFELKIESKVKILLFGGSEFHDKTLSQKIKDMIVNFGWINFSDDYEKLQCVDVFVLFKDDNLLNRAGWPNCLGDFFACGRPVLLNPVGEAIDFLNKNPGGVFVCSNSTESILKSLKFIIENTQVLEKKGRINSGKWRLISIFNFDEPGKINGIFNPHFY